MVQIVDPDAEAPEATTVSARPAAQKPSRAASILDAIRQDAAEAREDLTYDLPLPSIVPGNLALRLGIPTEIRESTLFAESGSTSVDNDLADVAENVRGVVDLDDPEEMVEGLSVIELATVFAEQLYGFPRPVTSEVDAVRELFSRGSPVALNAQALNSLATVYRRWSADPLPERSSDRVETS